MSNAHSLFAVYDSVNREFGPPVPGRNEESACRDFQTQVQGAKFPEDLSLYFVGTYIPDTGVIKGLKKPVFLTDAQVMESHDGK